MKVLIIYALLVVVPQEIFTDKVECKNVACPRPEPCPADSHPKPKVIHLYGNIPHHIRSKTSEIVRRERAIASDARQRETIKIIPGAYEHHGHKRSITDDEMLIQHCCPSYECVCKPNYCDQECPPDHIPANTTAPTDPNDLPYGVPGNCCFPCRNSYCMHDIYRQHGEKWRSDECTTCVCHYGEVKCQQSVCKNPGCLNHKMIPGECCPVCDDDATNFCQDIQHCNIHCQYGYRRQGNCDLCACARVVRNQTSIETDFPHPKVNVTVTDDDNTNGSVHRGPHHHHTHSDSSSEFNSTPLWIVVLLCFCGFAVFFLTIWWCCYNRKDTKYSVVQIA
ncbi:cysteine-rich motor neuron 1 protein-like [Sabethes cyaneus]|uniref:cysteine-rich motor neuron 1 protein-like n=1 Tax=Sabethes cyaneus TaxID=53552 RepID=UPI00237DE30A|nr:cysteine-rich motor neuron 1 protein-like [Sabethes cyaneus]XP_053683872.1 cysteine-rich motor neuron 1 protein-like [Sabethes cyaneus]XP_053683873.1 cysteine-rich motor neuron 1 protein-like [Sabethes cyaneus]XP_053683874.1 cysteine-rich motor neuron 1 protein-like [Sabethes cyaneus]